MLQDSISLFQPMMDLQDAGIIGHGMDRCNVLVVRSSAVVSVSMFGMGRSQRRQRVQNG
jgi:hypothetical protein